MAVGELVARLRAPYRTSVRTARAIAAAWVAALACLLAASPAAADSDEKCDTFDFYVLMRDWTPSLCMRYGKPDFPCSVPGHPENWVVHGLWPSTNPGEDIPFYCSHKSKFSAEPIESLVPQLEAIWPNLVIKESDTKPENRYESWRHEWEKHGTCAMVCDPGISDEADYFKLVLDLTSKYEIASALSQAGITPNDTASIATSSVADAMKKAFGVQPVVQCVTPDGGDTAYLYAIGLCFTKSSDGPMDCPAQDSPGNLDCPDDIVYPTKAKAP